MKKNKYNFNKLEKYIIWKTHNMSCYWCGEPLSLKNISIDHIIPECKDGELERIKDDYKLPPNFVINGFCNWVPAHNNCNSKKSFKLFSPSPVFISILNDIEKKSIPARESYEKIKRENKIDDILGKLTAIMEVDKISEKDIINQLGYEIFEDKQVENLELHIPPGWKVENVDIQSNIVTVSQGKKSGRTIIPPKDGIDPGWFCWHCRNYGPWSGSMCLSCGHFNDPFD